MTRQELYKIRYAFFHDNWDYECTHWTDFDFSILKQIMYRYRAGRGTNKRSINDCIIMADTETSKKENATNENHVCAWTISLLAFDMPLFTLYGHKPSTLIKCIKKMQENLQGDDIIVYFHNASYDWVFLRQFFFQEYGHPDKQLNTKSHYPILIQWTDEGLILKDSLILAQRSLDKWAKDMQVEHQKAVGKWDYDKIRNQDYEFNADELEYIEHDTLAGVECINALMKQLHKSIYSMPYTATGIPREELRNRGKEFHAHDRYMKQAASFMQQGKLEQTYHGGYTHGNRHLLNRTINEELFSAYECKRHMVEAYDLASSYPFALLSEKMPAEAFSKYDDCVPEDILEMSSNYAFMFKLIMVKPRLKDDGIEMPCLQFSKCTKTINAILDNGRILASAYAEIYITENDLDIIMRQYTADAMLCVEVEVAKKAYLPRWITDYVYEKFTDKTFLKGGDPVAYAIAKSVVNSIYGMFVQKPIKTNIVEDYQTGEYTVPEANLEELYEKHIKNHNSILPYQIGVWVTSAAFRNLFNLGECCKLWLYSDTDSCYGIDWDYEKLEAYNNEAKRKLQANGYGAVLHNGKEYWLGVAELDGQYSEYRYVGAKRYAARTLDGELKITVAGVPKKNGAKCLNDDINNFTPNLIFPGSITGKKTHTYYFINKIYIDEEGNETGDSIDLTDCDYLLDSVQIVDWEKLFTEEIEIQTYEEE